MSLDLASIASKFTTKTSTQKFLSKLADGGKYNVNKLTYPLDIEKNSNVYMMIYINENVQNKSSTLKLTDMEGSTITSKILTDEKTTKSTANSGFWRGATGNNRINTAIVLPLPETGLSAEYKNEWSAESTRSAQFVDQIIEPFMKEGLNMGNIYSRAVESASIVGKNIQEAKRALYEEVLGSAGQAYVGAQTRQVRNPAKEFLYKTPENRSFTFGYTLSPKSKDELYAIYNIIKTLKFYSHPTLATGVGNQSFYNYPAEFDVKFYTNGNENKWMFKTSSMGLSNLKETLSSDEGNMSFFENFDYSSGCAPKSIQLDLTFTELEILTRDRIEQGF